MEHKIELLPTAYTRAVALFYEAQDYESSNTLNGYQDAGKFFLNAARMLDPSMRLLPANRLRRCFYRIQSDVAARGADEIRRGLAPLFHTLGRREIFAAQARAGYARMEAYSRSLAALSGHRANSIFAARRMAEEAAKGADDPRLRDLPEWKECRFESYLAQALALALLGDRKAARPLLDEARGLDPARAGDKSSLFLCTG